jgi:murein DD-endopeptidase MepM/ murein hydrolase activator NlpD
MAGLGPFTAKGKLTQDFGPGIKAEPDGVWALRDAGGWQRARFDKFTDAVKRDDFHFGIDIAAAKGTALLAPERSKIVLRGEDEISGQYIIGQIQPGTYWYHGHCLSYVAKLGAWVPRGATVARMGETGKATGPHTHATLFRLPIGMSVRYWYSKGVRYNPERLMVGGDMATVDWIKPK